MLVAAGEQGEVGERAFPRCRRKDERWSERRGLSVTQSSREVPTLDSEERPMGLLIQRFLKALEAAEWGTGAGVCGEELETPGVHTDKNVITEEGEGGVPRGLSRFGKHFSTLETGASSTEVGRPRMGQKPKDRLKGEGWARRPVQAKGWTDGRTCR